MVSSVPELLSDRYVIEREIGRGGMATVYLARDLRHNRQVAVKVIRNEVPDEHAVERFLREIQIAAQLSHPNILPLHDSGEANGVLYYVMPYVAGETLRERLTREGPLPVADALRIAREVAEALSYAHSHDVVHRDIKPENILFLAGHPMVADFGIARAISAVGWGDRALIGRITGTPAYMSPEQATGSARVDGRSDIYSLGCVLYEMLSGDPPFVGPTPGSVTAGHINDPPPPLSKSRPALPPALESVVNTALAKLAADRYPTAQEFADALTVLAPAVRVERRTFPRAFAVAVIVAVVATLVALLLVVPKRLTGPKLDPELLVVVPFTHRAGAAPKLLTGDQCETLLYHALRQWQDVRLVDPLWVADHSARNAEMPTLSQAIELARASGAGRLLTGEVSSLQDTAHVRAIIYDVSSRSPITDHQVTVLPDLSNTESAFKELADSLLIGPATTPTAAGGAMGTRVVAAWRAFDAGHTALSTWDLAGADREFRHAIALDANYALAQLWLAQSMAWSGRSAEEWRSLTVDALHNQARLGPPDRLWGAALSSFAQGNFAASCDQFRQMIAADSLNFRGWFGLGDCQAQDPSVERDPKSPSGWRFRASYQAAINAYQRALTLLPSSHHAFRGVAFARLANLFYTENNHIRTGFAVERDTVWFGSFPGLAGDSLAFIPYPLAEVTSAKGPAFPHSTPDAITRNRALLRGITTAWVTAFPQSADALESHGRMLEAMGELDDSRPLERSALLSYHGSRTKATDEDQRVEVSVAELRVLLKLGRFEKARSLADSLLQRRGSPDSATAGVLAGVAALVGRGAILRDLLERASPTVIPNGPDGAPLDVPAALRETTLELVGFAALGGPVDSLLAGERRLRDQARNYLPPARQESTSVLLLHQVHALSFPLLGLQRAHRDAASPNWMLRMQRLLVQRDTAGLRQEMATLAEQRRQGRPGDVALDFTLLEMGILLQYGDTVEAKRRIDEILGALPTLGLALVGDVANASVPQAAALPQMLALRADLASRQGENELGGQRARQALALWSGAEPPLDSIVVHLKRLSAAGPPRR